MNRSIQIRMSVVSALLLVALCLPIRAGAQCGAESCVAGADVMTGYVIDASPVVIFDETSVVYVPVERDYFFSQYLAAAKAAAEQEDDLRRRLARNYNLFDVAVQAEQGGDVKVAARLYQRLALSRPRTEVTQTAQQRLNRIQGDAQQKLQALEDELNSLSGRSRLPSALKSAQLDTDEVKKIFAAMDKLAIDYSGVSSIADKIRAKSDQLRKQRQFAAVLQEPVAAELWKIGQKHEEQQQLCCAYNVYEEAARLAPAPSGEQAKARLAILGADETIIADARKCHNLQLCHEKFRKAQAIKDTLPERAREYLAQILEIAPSNTSVHKAAREQLAMLKKG